MFIVKFSNFSCFTLWPLIPVAMFFAKLGWITVGVAESAGEKILLHFRRIIGQIFVTDRVDFSLSQICWTPVIIAIKLI